MARTHPTRLTLAYFTYCIMHSTHYVTRIVTDAVISLLYHSLVLGADSRASGAGFTGGPLELGVCALTGAALARPSAVTDLLVTGHARAVVQGAVTGAACPRVVTDANSALATAMT